MQEEVTHYNPDTGEGEIAVYVEPAPTYITLDLGSLLPRDKELGDFTQEELFELVEDAIYIDEVGGGPFYDVDADIDYAIKPLLPYLKQPDEPVVDVNQPKEYGPYPRLGVNMRLALELPGNVNTTTLGAAMLTANPAANPRVVSAAASRTIRRMREEGLLDDVDRLTPKGQAFKAKLTTC